ncbi:NAD(P)H-dependent oxidoreductase [Litchfieldia alkalitelluris]|uniref:NAD(P)H-dependent oxidoreductase n=1 Tax=Litchfieldia alkalitelluris TaxID=304268 RepID=UPI001F3FE4DA|nr:NAD(P)H-dependent oxidoreductase [Litchfieldia alkalitelluris]
MLIVYVHPDDNSLNASLKDIAVDTLEAEGHRVVVSDLYAKQFKAVADKNDFTVLKNPHTFNYISEQYHAFMNNTFTEDILKEQESIIWADMIIFQYPMWWTDVPAMLKGWFDRVLAYKFAYGPGRYDQGNLTGKKAILSITHGGEDLSDYGEFGIKGKIEERLFNINHEKLYYCGMDVLEPFVFPASASEEVRMEHIKNWKLRLTNLANEKPIPYRTVESYKTDVSR